MFDFIIRLQKKPHRVRRIVAITVTVFIMAPVVTLWLLSLPLLDGSMVIAEEENTSSPFSLIGDEFSRAYGGIKAQLGEVSELQYVPEE